MKPLMANYCFLLYGSNIYPAFLLSPLRPFLGEIVLKKSLLLLLPIELMNQPPPQTIRRVAAALPGMESSDAAGNGEKPQNYREVVLNDDKIPDQHMQEGGCSC